MPNSWGRYKYGVLRACDGVCGKKKGKGSKGDTRWWNEEVKEAVSRKKDAHKAMGRNSAEKNRNRHKSMKNKARKVVSKATREKAEGALTELKIVQMECLD